LEGVIAIPLGFHRIIILIMAMPNRRLCQPQPRILLIRSFWLLGANFSQNQENWPSL
jgi:hypothetical protein